MNTKEIKIIKEINKTSKGYFFKIKNEKTH